MTRLYPSMAFTNIKSNYRTYVPYMISSTITVSIYYIICSLAGNSSLADMWGGNVIQSYMGMGQAVVSIFAFIFLFYINSFLVKRRRSEFGLYNILGLEKRHIAKVMFLETIYTYALVMAVGIFLGILLDKLMYLAFIKILGGSVPVGFYVSASGIAKSAALFGVIFILILANSVRQVYKSSPAELLKSSNTGEKEPKAKWILAVLGVICMCAGYFIAVTTENPVAAFMLFFIAVILVIIGTYLLFTSGSIALLKLMKKNKGYYYKTKHFISISSMMYRMKRNAVGLANICILSTMVLVMVSSTLSIYAGLGDSLEKRYPAEFIITSTADDPLNKDITEMLSEALNNEGLKKENEFSYKNLSVSAVFEKEKNTFVTDPDRYGTLSGIRVYDRLCTLVFVTLDDYNRCMDKDLTLKSENDVFMYETKNPLETDTFTLFGTTFDIKKELDDFMPTSNMSASIFNGYFIVVKDETVINDILKENISAYEDYASYIQFSYMTDIAGDPEKNRDAIEAVYNDVSSQIYDIKQDSSSAYSEFTGSFECRSIESDTFGDNFIGLFFIGLVLGLLFIMATVLIIYYKQLTEGYEDKKRFEIMQNVGMSHREVKKSINSQILIIFFMPLVTAGIHMGFAFPFIFRILTLMNLFNLRLFTICTAACFLTFTVFYIIVYLLTSRLYYRIVKK